MNKFLYAVMPITLVFGLTVAMADEHIEIEKDIKGKPAKPSSSTTIEQEEVHESVTQGTRGPATVIVPTVVAPAPAVVAPVSVAPVGSASTQHSVTTRRSSTVSTPNDEESEESETHVHIEKDKD